MQRLVGLVALLGVALAAGPAAAQRPARCQPVPNRAFDVVTRMDVQPPKLNRTLSRDQLSAFHPPANGGRVLGLTTYRLELQQVVNYSYQKQTTGFCFWVEKIDIVLRYPAIDVFVAKEYAPGSCAYRAILEHENKHASIARAHVDRYTPKFRLALESLKIPSSRAPIAVPSIEAAKEQVNAEVRRLLLPQHEQLMAEMGRAQAAIDTPESYAQVKRQCSDW